MASRSKVSKVSLSDSASDFEPPPGRELAERLERPEKEKKKKKKKKKKKTNKQKKAKKAEARLAFPFHPGWRRTRCLPSAVAENKMPRPLRPAVASSSGQPSPSPALPYKKAPRAVLAAKAKARQLLVRWPRVDHAWERRSKGAGGGSSSPAAASSSGKARSTHQHQEAEPRDAAPSERRRREPSRGGGGAKRLKRRERGKLHKLMVQVGARAAPKDQEPT